MASDCREPNQGKGATMKRRTNKVTTGSLVNKLERAIAVANMRGDRVTSELLCKKLADAMNSTNASKVLA